MIYKWDNYLIVKKTRFPVLRMTSSAYSVHLQSTPFHPFLQIFYTLAATLSAANPTRVTFMSSHPMTMTIDPQTGSMNLIWNFSKPKMQRI
jgi:hypothetical protein